MSGHIDSNIANDFYRPVFGDDTKRIVAIDPALAAYASLSQVHVAGLVAALRDYATFRHLLGPFLQPNESCDAPELVHRQNALIAACFVTRVDQTLGPKPDRHLEWRLGAAGGRRVFHRLDLAELIDQASLKVIAGKMDLSLGELCQLLSVLDCYARGAAPVPTAGVPQREEVLRAVYAHNALLTVRQSAFTIRDYVQWARDISKRTGPTWAAERRPWSPEGEADTSSSVPDYLEPLLGWRAWYVGPDAHQPRLTSVVMRTVWEPHQAMTATHGGRWCGKPNFRCTCGIYAFRTLDALRHALTEEFRSSATTRWVAGQVWLWGGFAEHQRGWRAQYAYPARIIYGHHCDAQAVAAAYGIAYEEVPLWTSVKRSTRGLRNHYDPRFPSHRRLLPSAKHPHPCENQPLNRSRLATNHNPRLYATLSFTAKVPLGDGETSWREVFTVLWRMAQRLSLRRGRVVR